MNTQSDRDLDPNWIRLSIPFDHVLELSINPEIKVDLQDTVRDWLADHGHATHWYMNNPWEAIFHYHRDNADQATLFKLTWG